MGQAKVRCVLLSKGFYVRLNYIGVNDLDINVKRMQARVRKGGHFIYDNSGEAPNLVFHISDNKLTQWVDELPKWCQELKNVLLERVLSNSYENTFNRMDKCDAYWHSKAGDLLISASILWKHKEEIGCWNTYKMLMGMSFELLIKAILIQSDISITHTHNLRNLANNIEVNLSKDDLNLLDILSEYIIWAGKYPIPKKSENLEKLYKLEQENLYDVVEKIGELELVSSNDKFDFDNLYKLWSKIAEKYRL
ncbi:hypothetical protein IO46_05880 [Gallibacterium anatis]|nr:hypothetical protein IO46_05880 [Gallibacterium anatis]